MAFGHAMVAEKQSEWQRLREVDAQRKQRTEFQQAQRDAQLAANATAQTLRKLHRPVIDRLFEQEKLSVEQHRAAEEIARIYSQVTKALTARTADLNRAGGGGSPGSFMPNIFTCGYQDRYLPWTVAMDRMPVVAGRTRLDLVVMLVVDNYGVRQIADHLCGSPVTDEADGDAEQQLLRTAKRRGSDQRTVLAAIQRALFTYAQMAGWVESWEIPNCAAPGTQAA